MNNSRLSISYSRKNITFVRRLALNLEQAGCNPWWDLADLRGGQAWAPEIERQVCACDAIVAVLTPDSTAVMPCSGEMP
ncbi:MAG: toll/interleukin-1 receptor domain-containing protein [Caldilinea sp.]